MPEAPDPSRRVGGLSVSHDNQKRANLLVESGEAPARRFEMLVIVLAIVVAAVIWELVDPASGAVVP